MVKLHNFCQFWADIRNQWWLHYFYYYSYEITIGKKIFMIQREFHKFLIFITWAILWILTPFRVVPWNVTIFFKKANKICVVKRPYPGMNTDQPIVFQSKNKNLSKFSIFEALLLKISEKNFFCLFLTQRGQISTPETYQAQGNRFSWNRFSTIFNDFLEVWPVGSLPLIQTRVRHLMNPSDFLLRKKKHLSVF